MTSLSRDNVIADFDAIPSVLLEALQGSMAWHGDEVWRCEWQIPSCNPISWLNAQTALEKIYWADRNGKLVVAGLGCADQLTATTFTQGIDLLAYMADALPVDFPNARYYGGLAFDASEGKEADGSKFPVAQFILPRFEIIVTPQYTSLALNLKAADFKPSRLKLVQNQVCQLRFNVMTASKTWPVLISRNECPTLQEWTDTFKIVKKNLTDKKYEKVVLARRSRLTFDQDIPTLDLLQRLQANTSSCFYFYFQYASSQVFLGASPERLYKREGTSIWSEAIAGTCARSTTPTLDAQHAKNLLASPKETLEHQLVVDHLREAFESLCCNYTIDEETRLLRLKAGQHLLTRCEGQLKNSVTDAQILELLPPTPAVAGRPTQAALAALKQLEPFDRGWYAGTVGYVGRKTTEFVVGIRSGLIQGAQLDLFAGAGIVPGSECQAEWDEIERKLSSFLEVVT